MNSKAQNKIEVRRLTHETNSSFVIIGSPHCIKYVEAYRYPNNIDDFTGAGFITLPFVNPDIVKIFPSIVHRVQGVKELRGRFLSYVYEDGSIKGRVEYVKGNKFRTDVFELDQLQGTQLSFFGITGHNIGLYSALILLGSNFVIRAIRIQYGESVRLTGEIKGNTGSYFLSSELMKELKEQGLIKGNSTITSNTDLISFFTVKSKAKVKKMLVGRKSRFYSIKEVILMKPEGATSLADIFLNTSKRASIKKL